VDRHLAVGHSRDCILPARGVLRGTDIASGILPTCVAELPVRFPLFVPVLVRPTHSLLLGGERHVAYDATFDLSAADRLTVHDILATRDVLCVLAAQIRLEHKAT